MRCRPHEHTHTHTQGSGSGSQTNNEPETLAQQYSDAFGQNVNQRNDPWLVLNFNLISFYQNTHTQAF